MNGPPLGIAAQDWAEMQEGQFRAGRAAVLEDCGIGTGVAYLDAGCRAGMAAAMAAARRARVAGFDAAESLLHIARSRTPRGRFPAG